MPGKKKKTRVAFRKNVQKRASRGRWRRQLGEGEQAETLAGEERVSGKGALTRYRTVVEEGATAEGHGPAKAETPLFLAVDESKCLTGRVVSVHRGGCQVETEEGGSYPCVVRGVLQRLAGEARGPLAVGDRVRFSPTGGQEGRIERVEPRRGTLSRAWRRREHVLVANVDQLLIVSSAAQPPLKPNLIDRYLVSAEKGGVRPVICINKVDLVELWLLQPIAGLYSQLGYSVLLTSATTGLGLAQLRKVLQGHQTVLSGQSGVGKSSLLNALQPGLELRVAPVVEETQKGRHATTVARLLRLDFGGWVVDTPGIRQFQLWDVMPEELEGFFIEFRPFVPHCKFPDCTHTHEEDCAVKQAVADGLIAESRYESYLRIFHGELVE